jgi:hypothetical protein
MLAANERCMRTVVTLALTALSCVSMARHQELVEEAATRNAASARAAERAFLARGHRPVEVPIERLDLDVEIDGLGYHAYQFCPPFESDVQRPTSVSLRVGSRRAVISTDDVCKLIRYEVGKVPVFLDSEPTWLMPVRDLREKYATAPDGTVIRYRLDPVPVRTRGKVRPGMPCCCDVEQPNAIYVAIGDFSQARTLVNVPYSTDEVVWTCDPKAPQ